MEKSRKFIDAVKRLAYIVVMKATHEINKSFIEATDAETREEVLTAIQLHYGISRADALDEVTTDGAEHLCEYLVGSVRQAVSVLMRRHAIAE